MLLKLIGGEIVYVLRVQYMPGTTAHVPGAEPGRTVRYSIHEQ